jgi:two-component system aerobic respiration control sensor histidine kinase ArcB
MCPLEAAYCRRTVERDSILAVQDATVSTEIADSAVETFDLGTYVGAKVVVEDEVYGTVCFADEETKTLDFTDKELFFVELVANLVGQAYERRAYEQELAAREASLKEEKEIFRAVIDASFDLIVRVDREGTYTYPSPPVEDLLGYTPDEYVGKNFTFMLPDEETIEHGKELFEQVLAGETVQAEYFPLATRRGDRVFVDIRVTPMHQSDVAPEDRTPEHIVGAQGMARDATERFRRERLIRVLNRVLRHNLRNDLGVIKNFAEVLGERLDEENASIARRISETSDRLVTLSETARDLEENWETPIEIEQRDIVPFVRRAVTEIDEKYPESSIDVETPESVTAACADRLETAIWELLENAAKHGGDEPRIDVSIKTEADSVVLEITDTGPGLPEDEQEVLASGEETSLIHGSGLGLWLVHWIIESMEGDIEVDETETGTYIEIRLHQDVQA